MNNSNGIIAGLLVGVGVVAIGSGIAMFSKKMIREGHPGIAKLPIKALDRLAQNSSSHDFEKGAVSVISKMTETEIDLQYCERNR